MKRQRLYNNFKIILLVMLVLAFMVAFLDNYLLPIKLKNYLQNSLSTAINKPVYFERLGFNLFRGAVIDNITIFKTDKKEEIFLSAEHISFNPLLLPILKGKIVIMHLVINKLDLKLERDKQGRLNIIELFPSKNKKDNKRDFFVAVTDFALKDSAVTIEDNLLEETQITVFENLNARAYFSLPAKVKFNLKSSLKNKGGNICIKGTYYFTSRYLVSNLNCLDLNLYKFSPYFKDRLNVSIEKDTTDIAADIILDSDNKVTVDGTTYINDIQAKFVSLVLDGSIVTKGHYVYNLNDKSIPQATGSIILKKNNLKGVLYVNELKDIEGIVDFTKEGLFIKELHANTKGIPFEFQGHFKNFRNPELKLTAKSDLKLQEAISQLPPRFTEKLKDIEIKGDTVLSLDFEGTLKEFWSGDFIGNVELTDVIIKSTEPAIEIKNIDSKVRFTRDELSVDNLTMEFKDKSYSATATVSSFTPPLVDFKLTSDDLFSKGQVKISRQTVEIAGINGKYKDIDFEVTGQAYNFADPVLNVYVKSSSKIENLPNVFPKLKEHMQKLNLAGKFDSTVYFEGKAFDPLSAFARLNVSSPQMETSGLKIKEIQLNAQLKEKQVTVSELNGSFYDGQIKLTADSNISNLNQPHFQADFSLLQADLSKLIKDTNLKDKKIKGLGTLKCSLKGDLNNTASFTGSGWISIKDGHLWEMPILKKLAAFLNIPQLENVVFTDAFGNYQIQNSRITTEDLTFLSDQVSIIVSGALGFDKGLDFLIQTQFSEEFYKSLVDRGQMAPIFLETLAKYALNVKLTGTTKDPKFKLKPISIEDILKDSLLKGLGDIFR